MGQAPSAPERIVKPQSGPQEMASASSADILFYGGQAGGGKSWLSAFEAARWVHLAGYNAIIFRRELTQARGGGGIIDESEGLYPALGGAKRESPSVEWRFPSGARVEFSHLQHESDLQNHHSKQYAVIIFEEATQFTAKQFWYMLSRNRSVCGVRPYFRATCNPDPESFVAELIAWWIGEDGFAIPERSGVLRWFIRDLDTDELIWGDTREEILLRCKAGQEPFSLTFVEAKLEDNPAMTSKDPQYGAKLMLLNKVDRERLRSGNWKIKPAAGLYFREDMFEVVDAPPTNVLGRVRGWDKAATTPSADNPDPAWTVGVKISKVQDAAERVTYYIEDVVRMRGGPGAVQLCQKNTASQDGIETVVAVPQDPGQAGKVDIDATMKLLCDYTVKPYLIASDKITYAGPVSAQAEHGNIKLVRGPWNKVFLQALDAFPKKGLDDVDALSLAYRAVNEFRPILLL